MLALLYLLNMAWGFFMETRSRRLISASSALRAQGARRADVEEPRGILDARRESRDDGALLRRARLHVDLRGLSPEGLRDLMNTYLTAMTEVIQRPAARSTSTSVT